MADRDDRSKPALGRLPTPPPVPRQDPRDFTSRPKSHPLGVPVGEFGAVEEKTEVGTDVQVFRAVKNLHKRLTESEASAAKSHGELKTEVNGLREDVQGLAIGQATTAGKLDVLLAMQRSRSPSSTKDIVEASLAKQVLAQRSEDVGYSRKVKLLIIGGVITLVTSGVFLHWLAGKV